MPKLSSTAHRDIVARMKDADRLVFASQVTSRLRDTAKLSFVTNDLQQLHGNKYAKRMSMVIPDSDVSSTSSLWLSGAAPHDFVRSYTRAFVDVLDARGQENVDNWAGLFRVAGNRKDADTLADGLMGNVSDNHAQSATHIKSRLLMTLSAETHATATIAMVFKKFVRSHKPVIPDHSIIPQLQKIESEEKRVEAYRLMLWLLPANDREIVMETLPLLGRIAERELDQKKDQKMTTDGLAKMFSVNLFAEASTPAQIQCNTAIVTDMITHAEKMITLPESLHHILEPFAESESSNAISSTTASTIGTFVKPDAPASHKNSGAVSSANNDNTNASDSPEFVESGKQMLIESLQRQLESTQDERTRAQLLSAIEMQMGSSSIDHGVGGSKSLKTPSKLQRAQERMKSLRKSLTPSVKRSTTKKKILQQVENQQLQDSPEKQLATNRLQF